MPETIPSSLTRASLQELLVNTRESNQTSFLVHLSLPQDLHINSGAPADVWVRIVAVQNSNKLTVELMTFGKTTTRLPEALFFSFVPLVKEPDHGWWMDKLGRMVKPYDVIVNGSFHLNGTLFEISSQDYAALLLCNSQMIISFICQLHVKSRECNADL